MNTHIFLVEIGTEELPSRLLKKLGGDFFNQIISGLKKYDIHVNMAEWFASSCHLAVKTEILIKKMYFPDDVHLTYINDYKSINFNQKNICIDSMIKNNNNILFNDQSRFFFHEKLVEFNNLSNLLLIIIKNSFSKLSNYSMMRWGDVSSIFIRPVRSVVILLDSYLISGRIFNVNSDRVVYGHKCMKDNQIVLHHASDYPEILKKKGKVIVDYNVRKIMICTEIEKKSKELGGIISSFNDVLLEELTALVEWPVILCGYFNEKFLKLPYEVILHIMQYHQKCFPVYNVTKRVLLPCFIFVSNTISDNYQSIIFGYENVIKTRLMDAEFFFKSDSKYCLADYVPKLDNVLFHGKLGTLLDKSFRIQALSGWIAEKININILEAKRAGYLCKCDLMSHMVYEFPEMQGIIGKYYARRDYESESVVLAQQEHYQPRFSKDVLPNNLISCIVSIADKMDTISGIFGIRELPKGNRDPFALKRCAMGILRIFIEKKILLNLLNLVQYSVNLYKIKLANTVINDVMNFMYKRLYAWYVSQGYSEDIIKAVLGVKCVFLVDFHSRVNAINNFLKLKKEEYIKLKLIYKRISNILLKNNFLVDNENIQYDLLKSFSEKRLFDQIFIVEKKLKSFLEQNCFYEILCEIAQLYDFINIFFNTVVIMDNDNNVRINRLNLLKKIRNLYLTVADFSFLYF